MKKPEFVKMKIQGIKPYAKNPRIIPQEAVDGIAGSIKAYGYISPICVDQDGVVLAGHTTLQAAKKAGLKEVDVVRVEIDETLAMGYRIADNKTAELARWDQDLLIEEARDIMAESPELLGELGMADWELSRLCDEAEREISESPAPPPLKKMHKDPPAYVEEVRLIQRCVIYVDRAKDIPAFLKFLGVERVPDVPISIRASQIFGGPLC